MIKMDKDPNEHEFETISIQLNSDQQSCENNQSRMEAIIVTITRDQEIAKAREILE